MKILYLYAEVMGYTLATVRELASSGNEVHIIHWDKKKLTPYKFSDINNVFFYNRSDYNLNKILKLALFIKPDIIVISGWMDKIYLLVSFILKLFFNKLIVVAFDSQWNNSFKNYILLCISKLYILKLFFSYAWVAGYYQYEFARKIGFNKRFIIYDLYSADTNIFKKKDVLNINKTENLIYPHRFIFVGRFENIKGLNVLLKAWQLINFKKDWTLHFIGNGSMLNLLNSFPDIIVKDFKQPHELQHEILNAGCFILPSLSEPWGVVIHEFASAGLPLIVSDSVGSASTFLVSGLNGFTFRTADFVDLSKKMQLIINMNDSELIIMSNYSVELSKRISPITSANNLLSIFK
jgi:glycosyltransferase involved in cell wall biosynthesis